MATPIYIRLLERKIERLKDPYGLSDREKAGIDELLSDEELEEVEARRVEIYNGNLFMALPTDVEWPDFTLNSFGGFYNAYYLFYLEHPGQLTRLASARKRIATKKAKGVKNPTAYEDDAGKVAWHTRYAQELIDAVKRGYEQLPPEKALFWEHRGEWTADNMPRHVESWENAFWPSHPNARRQAYIEVLSEKLERARNDDLN